VSNIIAIASQAAPYKLEISEMQTFVFGKTNDEITKRKFGFLLKDQSIKNKYAAIPDFNSDCKIPLLYKHNEALPDTSKRMKIFESEATALACSVAQKVIQKAKLSTQDITHIVTVSCTGLVAPGLEILLSEQLNLASNVQRHAVNFMGCYAAFHGMRLADLICRADQNSTVLVVCVELCSLHFRNDSSDDNLLSTYLFSDGASACIVSNQQPSTAYLLCKQFESILIPEGKKDMAWHIGNTGFEMILKKEIPKHIEKNIKSTFLKLIAKHNLEQKDIQHFAIHPGGKNILNAFESALSIPTQKLEISRSILYEYGNMSSATILFVLEKFLLENSDSPEKSWLYSAAFGPGLTVENGLFELVPMVKLNITD
jgi:alpha-pyrone synthase